MTQKIFALPDLGEGLTESDITAWHVAVGDVVEVNQVLAEVETAKAVVELSSPYAGTIAGLHAEAGDTVQVGAPVVTFDLGGDGPTEDSGDGRVPTLVGYGAAADSGRPARRARRGAAAASDSVAPSAPERSATPAAVRERPRSTPPVRLFAKQHGVDLETVTGTGTHGVITRADVEAVLRGAGEDTDSAAETAAEGAQEEATTPTLGGRPREVRLPVKGVRRATAQAMVQSAFTAPHVTEFLQVDVTESMELLAELKASRDFRDVKLTPMTLAARACVLCMERTPEVNACWDEAAATVVQQNYVNLGFAAATPRGLMVPNVKDAQAMDLRALGRAIAELTATAREGRLSPEQMSGGTFTLTNVGVFGVDAGTPIINPGEGAILAIGQVRTLPWEHRGEIALRQVMTLSLSFDHRFIDGEQGSRFLADVGAMLRRPGLTLAMV